MQEEIVRSKMGNYYSSFLGKCLYFILVYIVVQGNIFKSNAQVVICAGDTVVLTIDGTGDGIIQWQHSPDADAWQAVIGGVYDTTLVVVDESTYYRAMVLMGTCRPLFTDAQLAEILPGPEANAGQDQLVCDTTVVLSAILQSGETGIWTISGGTGATINDPSNPNSIFSGEQGETYTLTWTVTNICGVSFDGVEIEFVNNPRTNAGADVEICQGSETLIGWSPTVCCGAGGYSFDWMPMAGLDDPNISNPTASPAISTIYTVIATDLNGCQDSDSVLVEILPNPVVDAGNDLAVCPGDSAMIGGNPTASSGTPGYSYTWMPVLGLNADNSSNPLSEPIVTTTYTVNVTDEHGCTGSDEILVTVYENPVANAGTDMEICEGLSTVIGGNPTAAGGSGVYTYSWSPADGLSLTSDANPTSSTIETRIYTVSITDSNGCMDDDQVTVTVHPNPVADAGIDQEFCNGTSSVIGGNPAATGGDGTYNYSWSPTSNLDSSNVANPTASPSISTIYTLSVADGNGCIGLDNVSINILSQPTVDAGQNVADCIGNSFIIGGSPTASGSLGPYSYVWTPADSLSDTISSNPVANPLGTVIYRVEVTDANSCTALDTVQIIIYQNPIAEAGFTTASCQGSYIPIGGDTTAYGGTPPYTYSWLPAATLDDPASSNPNASPPVGTTYTVTVTDANGCTDSDDVFVDTPPGCPGQPTVTDADGNVYNTIQIGSQCWMSSNLNVGTQIQGNVDASDNGIIEKYCMDNDPLNCDFYGGLYQWQEMMEYNTFESGVPGTTQGICPLGWHVPTHEEWCILEDYVDSEPIACASVNGDLLGTDVGRNLLEGGSTCFEGLFGGARYINGDYQDLEDLGIFWTASESSNIVNMWVRIVFDENDQIQPDDRLRTYGLSVRCLRD